MPKPSKGPRLGGSPAHERLILSNLATALFEHGRIKTTEAKARRLRPFAEKLITKARRGDIHARRQVLTVIRDKGIVHTLFTEIAPRYENRPGGYTRITKIGPRRGDNAPMAVIELVEEAAATATRTRRSRTAATAPATKTEPAADETTETESGAAEATDTGAAEATETTGTAGAEETADTAEETADTAEETADTAEESAEAAEEAAPKKAGRGRARSKAKDKADDEAE